MNKLGTATSFMTTINANAKATTTQTRPHSISAPHTGLFAKRSGIREAAERGLHLRDRSKSIPAPRPHALRLAARRVAVALGISTGGPATLYELLPQLPADLPASIFLVQHIPLGFTASLARRLAALCKIKVVEAREGMVVEPGVCYLAAAGSHLCLEQQPSGDILIRTPAGPHTAYVPSVDVMMASVLDIYGSDTIGVLMTGMGYDGADQMVAIRRAGGHTIAESEETAVINGMPREARKRGGACLSVPSHRIADQIVEAVELMRE